jgi:hypothetical protein
VKPNAGSSKDTETLELELASLRDEYDEMINVAEEQFNIKIRKKVGANSDKPAYTRQEVLSYRDVV